MMIPGHPPLFQMSKTQEPKPQSQGISRLQRWSGTTWNLQQRVLRLLCHSMVPALLSDETETTGTLAAKRGSKMPISWGSERGLMSLRANKIVGASSVNLGFWAPITCRAWYDIYFYNPKKTTHFPIINRTINRIMIMILLCNDTSEKAKKSRRSPGLKVDLDTWIPLVHTLLLYADSSLLIQLSAWPCTVVCHCWNHLLERLPAQRMANLHSSM